MSKVRPPDMCPYRPGSSLPPLAEPRVYFTLPTIRWAALPAESSGAPKRITTDTGLPVSEAAAVRRQGHIASGVQPEAGTGDIPDPRTRDSVLVPPFPCREGGKGVRFAERENL
jgi:hypothetical protein